MHGGLYIVYTCLYFQHLSPAKWSLESQFIGSSWLISGLNIFYFPIYWEESSHLTNIFQRGGSTTNQIILGFDYKSLSIPGSKSYGLHCGVPGLAPTAAYTYIYIYIYIYIWERNKFCIWIIYYIYIYSKL